MKTVLRYIYYFFYNAVNWNLWLAFFTFYQDIRGARKYGISTFSPVKLSKLTIAESDLTKSQPYEAVNYYMLEKLLTAFRKLPDSASIVDLGCGKGRVMVVAAYFGFKQITGIDFAKELCEEAARNMEKTQQKIPGIRWNIVHANVLDYTILPDDAIFFMFNPFAERTLVSFLKKLERSCKQFPRKTYFIYASPQHSAALEQRGYQVVFRQALMNLKGAIFCKE